MASRVARGQHYLGETKKQLREGYGMYKYPNSYFKYEGEWKEGKKHGHGKLMMADGGFYEGEFINGEIEGHGFRKWAISGNTYSGQFESGEMNGFGVLTYPDGTVYEGEFQNNMKEGHGILKYSDGAVYEGSFHKNKRHGGGSQVYANGDHFVGDWVYDKRQGSGELRLADGSVYEGQWRNDIFNGEGTLIHVSGMIYEGIWINGKPKHEAKEMVIVGKTLFELTQGTPFDIHVEIRQEDGELVELDMGRELKITAGFRHFIPTEGMQLLDVIEDIEETPRQTPLFDLLGQENILSPGQHANEENALETPVPPPVTNQRTNKGRASFKSVILPGAPQGYRAFQVLDALLEEEARNKARNQKTGRLAGQLGLGAKLGKTADEIPDSLIAGKLDPKTQQIKRERRYGDERFARPGDYVIMIEDVTMPPFLDVRLEPVFILVKVSHQKKLKKAKSPKNSRKGTSEKD
ncbi:MORN repeat-containing protein 1-like [Anneissia japonica]|uniref:MORN repeat-containing protein 1-like n=1 Tax=Anneissia japonica TaxID=1529436 RepID=UPI001425936A|nr:MORN repeat-containing protein 1-like [Anneissia japonica]